MSRVHVTDQKDMDKFNEVSSQKYSDQAIFFLNAFWKECGSHAEKIYEYNQGFIALDSKKDDGCDLDEFYSHKFLETYGETMTALELRNAMRKIDINHDNRMSFLEYLLYRYEQTVEELLLRPQGFQSEELLAALKALSQAREDIRRAEASKLEMEASKAQAEISKMEVEASRAEVSAIRTAIDSKRDGLEKAAQAGGVKGNMAKQELFALNNEDSTELNAAILRADAAVRKAEAAVKKAEEAVQKADAAVKKAEHGVKNAEDAVRKAQSVGDKNSPGMVWFMNRELEEAKKYQPRGGIQKADKFKHL